MPFLNTNEEDLKKQQAAQTGQQISGQSNVLNTGAVPATKGPSSSGQFVNINKYLEANKDNTASMANKMSEDVTKSAEGAQASSTDYKSGIQDTGLETAESLGTSFYNDPSKANKATYQAKKTGQYTGPNAAEDVKGYDDLRVKSTAAANKVKNITGDVGQGARDIFSNQNYSAGANKLDTALLQGDTGAKATLAGTGKKFEGIDKLLSGATNEATTRIGANKQNVEANKNLITSEEERIFGAQNKALSDKASLANQQAAAENARYASTAPDAMWQLTHSGDVNTANLEYHPNVDWRKFATSNIGTATAGSSANPEERARYSALAGLMDRTDTLDTGAGITKGGFNRAGYDTVVSTEKAKEAAAAQAQKDAEAAAAAESQAQSLRNEKTFAMSRMGDAPTDDQFQEYFNTYGESAPGDLKKRMRDVPSYSTPTGGIK